MNKKQIQELSKKLVERTKGQFHYEEEYWKQYFPKNEIKNIQKKIDICMQDKNYNYFCEQLFNSFNNLYKARKV